MSDYPNMSYCMCENTLSAMRQVAEAYNECDSLEEFIMNMNASERYSFRKMIELSAQLVEEFEVAYEEGIL